MIKRSHGSRSNITVDIKKIMSEIGQTLYRIKISEKNRVMILNCNVSLSKTMNTSICITYFKEMEQLNY